MNNQRILLFCLVLLIFAFVVLPFGGATIAQIGIESSSVENITIEQGINKSFILCQPNVHSVKALKVYIENAHGRLSNADQSLVTEAIVTFTKPLTQNDFEQTVLGMPINIISTRSISKSIGEVIEQYPLSESESNLNKETDDGSEIVSMRISANVASLVALTLNSKILCVDAGAIDELHKYKNAMIIFQGDLYQSIISDNITTGKLALGTIPASYSLDQNYPNPFNPKTDISFSLPEASKVKLEIYNTLGQLVTVLFDGELEAGLHSYEWDASSIASGMYLYRLTSDNFTSTKKMMLLK